jgi:hypothetical protein
MVKKEQISQPGTIESRLPTGGCGEPAIDRYGREWAAKLRELEREIGALGVENVDLNNDRQVWDYVYNVLQFEPEENCINIPDDVDIPAELVSVGTLSRIMCQCSQSDKRWRFLRLLVEYRTFKVWLDAYGQFENAVIYYRQSIGEQRRVHFASTRNSNMSGEMP